MADLRYKAEDGTVWASRYEWEVYEQLRLLDLFVRKCEAGESDTIHYPSAIRNGTCLECESGRVVQQRSYTPDILISRSAEDSASGKGIIVEAKGYWRVEKRRLLREAYKSAPGTRLLLVFQGDKWITKGKSKYSDYTERYLKGSRCVIWNSRLKNPGTIITEEEALEWLEN